MNIIEYKPSVTIVASETEWRQLMRDGLCSEHDKKIRTKLQWSKINERHAIAITFDHRLDDLFSDLKQTSVPVRNQTRSSVVAEATGIART